MSNTNFLTNETGAVTVDWVVLTAGLVGLGLATLSVVSTGVEDLSGDIDAELKRDHIIQTGFITATQSAENAYVIARNALLADFGSDARTSESILGTVDAMGPEARASTYNTLAARAHLQTDAEDAIQAYIDSGYDETLIDGMFVQRFDGISQEDFDNGVDYTIGTVGTGAALASRMSALTAQEDAYRDYLAIRVAQDNES